MAVRPSAQDVHFGVVQEYCKKKAQRSGGGEHAYIESMVVATGGRRR